MVVFVVFSSSTESTAQTEQELRAEWEQNVQNTIDLAILMHVAHNLPVLAYQWAQQAQAAVYNTYGALFNLTHMANVLYNNSSTNMYVDLNNSVATLSINTHGTYTSWHVSQTYTYSVIYTLDLNTWTWNAGNNTNVGQNIFTPVSWEDYLAQHNPQPEPTPDVITPGDGSESDGDGVIPMDGEELDVEPLEVEDDEDEPSITTPSSNPPQVFESTATPEGLSTSNYMATFFSNPVAKDLKLYVPGYAYFQGIVYSKGNITALGPIRVIGGIVTKAPPQGSSEPKGITLKKGAMLTTDPEYLNRRTNPPQVRLRVTQWEEIPVALKSR